MLDRLLESKPARERPTGGAILSITAHTALIAAAVYATAQARVQAPHPSELVRAIYFPRIPDAASPPRTPEQRSKPIAGQRLIFVDPAIDIKLPPVDVEGVLSSPTDFVRTPLTFGGGSAAEGSGPAARMPFSAAQVEKQVAIAAGNAPPRYPEALRQLGIEGRVLATFVVNEQGRAEEESIRFARSDNQLFEDAVRVALRRMRFIPAEVGGRKVRQLVEMPFVFTISR